MVIPIKSGDWIPSGNCILSANYWVYIGGRPFHPAHKDGVCVCVCVCARACVRACVRVRVRACVCVCVRARVCA